MPLTQTQLAGAVADRAEITRAEAKRVLDALEDVDRQRGEGQDRRARAADGAREARLEGAPRPQPRDRRGDHNRRETRERRCARTGAHQGQGCAAVGAEGAPTPGQLTINSEVLLGGLALALAAARLFVAHSPRAWLTLAVGPAFRVRGGRTRNSLAIRREFCSDRLKQQNQAVGRTSVDAPARPCGHRRATWMPRTTR